jgi:hypothetical protein
MPTSLPVHATVTHKFPATPERVFDAWLDTGMVSKSMFGPHLREEEIVSLKADVHVGAHSLLWCAVVLYFPGQSGNTCQIALVLSSILSLSQPGVN